MQDNNIKISIIMPVYNVSRYLKKSIESVIGQSFKDFEFYLVDDGSTDNSGEICDEYSKIDNRIIVLHQENQGAHNARNNALKLAKGKYVCFFDSDDYIDTHMLSDLYDLAEKNESDMVVSGFYINTYYDDENYITLDYIPYTRNGRNIEVYDNAKDFRLYAYKNFDKNMFYPPWNKMYRLSYLRENNITFPITYRDDFPFVLNVIRDIQRVTYTKNEYYNFIRKRTDSETQKYVANLYEKREEEHKMMLELYRYWNLANDADSIEMISRRYIDRLIECIVNLFNSECTLDKNQKKKLIKMYFENENFLKSIKCARPKKLYLKLMYIPLLIRNVSLSYFMGKVINFIKSKNIKTFSLLKTNR